MDKKLKILKEKLEILLRTDKEGVINDLRKIQEMSNNDGVTMEEYLAALSFIENDVIEFSTFSYISETEKIYSTDLEIKSTNYQQVKYDNKIIIPKSDDKNLFDANNSQYNFAA